MDSRRGAQKRSPNDLLRRARGSLTQGKLADLVSAEIYRATGEIITVEAKTISDYERGWYRWPSKHVRAALRTVLKVETDAELGFEKRRAPATDRRDLPVSVLDLMGEYQPGAEEQLVRLPGGRSFAGADVAAHFYEVKEAGTDWLLVDPGRALPDTLNRPDRRALVLAVDHEHRLYASDARRFVGRSTRRTGPQPVPSATVIDDFTVGIIWATTNADTALLADDAELFKVQDRICRYEEQTVSSLATSEVPMLGPVSTQWLGSRFCSRHITRYLGLLDGEPFFWTREQRGEEAASWLLWDHKYEYLRRTSRWFPDMRRGFCIPESEVGASPRYERVMLLLAMALMEAFGIRVELSPEPGHAEVEGFVLAQEAIVANWLRGSGVWYVEANASDARRSVYCDIARQLASDSLIDQPTSARRLAAAAGYLNIPWQWFYRRCEELAVGGVDDISNPRSRLLSTRGLNTAIRYVAYLDTVLRS